MRTARLVLACFLLSFATATHADPPKSIDAIDAIEFVAANAISTANGAFHSWKITASQIDFANLTESFVEVEVDLSSVDTGSEGRDEHLLTADFFEVETFPTATARLHSAAPRQPDAAGRPQYDIAIDLTMHGATHSVPGQFSVVSEAPLQVEGSFSIDRNQWGIGEPDQWFNPMAIRDAVAVNFRATLGE